MIPGSPAAIYTVVFGLKNEFCIFCMSHARIIFSESLALNTLYEHVYVVFYRLTCLCFLALGKLWAGSHVAAEA